MASNEPQGAKRKRSPIDDAPPPHQNPPQVPNMTGNVAQINYLMKDKNDKLKLIEGDSDTFANVLSMIDEYEGVLQRHESLAANLGAKLVGPLLLKSFEKLFENPITILQSDSGESVTWLEIVDFARTNPNAFVIRNVTGGSRVCHFWLNHCCVQISEDDHRLILSGAPERMIPTEPILEDEISELGTLDILDQRLRILIRKADLVAGRARQLNYHLKGRRTAIKTHRTAIQSNEPGISATQGQSGRQQSAAFPPINGDAQSATLHEDLLRQFLSFPSTPSSGTNNGSRTLPPRTKSISQFRPTDPHGDSIPAASPNDFSAHDPPRRASQPGQPIMDEISSHHCRHLMTAKNEKLSRGDQIWPPCDRCRRLRMDCTKHLTACAGCTKKHAKCTWNEMSEEEVGYILGGVGETQGGVSGSGSAAGGDDTNAAGNNESDTSANLDPGLRDAGGDSGINLQGGGEVFDDLINGQQQRQREEVDELLNGQQLQQRQREGIDEQQHIILSRMASSATAAAAGRTA